MTLPFSGIIQYESSHLPLVGLFMRGIFSRKTVSGVVCNQRLFDENIGSEVHTNDNYRNKDVPNRSSCKILVREATVELAVEEVEVVIGEVEVLQLATAL